MDRDVLMHQITERFQGLYKRALDRAPDGQATGRIRTDDLWFHKAADVDRRASG